MSDLVERLMYRVGNPSAWPEGFDQAASDDFREAAAALASQAALIAELQGDVERLRGALDALPDLSHVISWLENGFSPKNGAKELRIYAARISALKGGLNGK